MTLGDANDEHMVKGLTAMKSSRGSYLWISEVERNHCAFGNSTAGTLSGKMGSPRLMDCQILDSRCTLDLLQGTTSWDPDLKLSMSRRQWQWCTSSAP